VTPATWSHIIDDFEPRKLAATAAQELLTDASRERLEHSAVRIHITGDS
jgi:hypothetical protein